VTIFSKPKAISSTKEEFEVNERGFKWMNATSFVIKKEQKQIFSDAFTPLPINCPT